MIRIKNIVLFVFVFVVVFSLLRNIRVLCQLCLCFLALYLTDFIVKTIRDLFHLRQLLPELQNKAVLITGCDTGFGHELAKRLDKVGVTVFAGCLYPEGQGALKLKKLCSEKLHVIHLDVTEDELVKAALKYVTISLGDKKLWALVNNAGIITYGEVELCSMKNMQHVMDVNVIGTVRVTQTFLPLIRRACGRIVIVSSIAGRYTLNGLVSYSMSKHAEVSLCDGLRREMMKFNVSVHSIEPWMYSTRINNLDTLQSSVKENWKQTPENVKRDYGEDFLKETLEHYEAGQQHFKPSSQICEVVDDMMDAAVGENPKDRYEEGTIWIIKILMYLPTEWLDQFMYKHSPRNVLNNSEIHLATNVSKNKL